MIGKTVQVLVEGESKLASKPAYPSSSGGVELGWEKRSATATLDRRRRWLAAPGEIRSWYFPDRRKRSGSW